MKNIVDSETAQMNTCKIHILNHSSTYILVRLGSADQHSLVLRFVVNISATYQPGVSTTACCCILENRSPSYMWTRPHSFP